MRTQLQRGFGVSWKLRLNLCSQRRLRPSLNLITNLNSFGLWHWKILLGQGLTSFKILSLKTLYVAEFRREASSLFHCKINDGKNVSYV